MSLAKIFKAKSLTEEEMSELYEGIERMASLCEECTHLHLDLYTCKAFPDGIPLEVRVGMYDHRLAYDGDGGVLFSRAVQKADISQVPRDANGQWTKVGGQRGSNPGGVYEKDGKKHYVKFPHEPGQVNAEVAADKIHELMGIRTVGHRDVTIGEQRASVSEMQKIKPLRSEEAWANLDEKQRQQAANAFVASALVKNWDVVGMDYDNMGTTEQGDLAIVDTGGSFMFRAQGGPKPFSADAEVEIKNFLNPEKTSGRVFGPLMQRHPEVFKAAAKRLKELPDSVLTRVAIESGFNADVAGTLHKRKAAILAYFDKP